MNEIIIIDKKTFNHVMETLRFCRRWLDRDAKFAHPNSSVRDLDQNVEVAINLMNRDLEYLKDNTVILEKMIQELNNVPINKSGS